MTRFDTAIEGLAARLQEQAGHSVVYRQGTSVVIRNITAAPSDEEYKISDGDGGFTVIQSIDWIFTVSDLGGLTPLRGDRIIETIGSETFEYEVMPIDKRPCFEWHDNAHVMYLIHSKRTK